MNRRSARFWKRRDAPRADTCSTPAILVGPRWDTTVLFESAGFSRLRFVSNTRGPCRHGRSPGNPGPCPGSCRTRPRYKGLPARGIFLFIRGPGTRTAAGPHLLGHGPLHDQGISAEGAGLFPDPRSPEGRHKVRGRCPAGFLLAEARWLRGHLLDERGLGFEARHPDDANRGLAFAAAT